MKQFIVKLIKPALLFLLRKLVYPKFKVLNNLIEVDRERLNELERRIQVLEGKEKLRQLGGIK